MLCDAYDLCVAVRMICALQCALQCDVQIICALQCDIATVHSTLYTPHMSTICGVYIMFKYVPFREKRARKSEGQQEIQGGEDS